MSETARLEIAVETTGIDTATTRLGRLQRASGEAETATGRLSRAQSRAHRPANRLSGAMRGVGATLARIPAPAAAAAAALASIASALGASKLIEVTAAYEGMLAALETSTGSVENAQGAFAKLNEFAQSTPYNLEQSVTAFNQLVNLGLTPSEEALRSFGDTASAMNEPLSGMVAAVADAAASFEFERLLAFGIKAKQSADSVAFTFQGMTTKVGKNASEIEQYLINLGQTKFAGGMKRQTATMTGVISNLKAAWNDLFWAISQSGIGDAIKKGMLGATEALKTLTLAVKAPGYAWDWMQANTTRNLRMIDLAVYGSAKSFDAHFTAAVLKVTARLEQLLRNAVIIGKALGKALDPRNWLDGAAQNIEAQLQASAASYASAAAKAGNVILTQQQKHLEKQRVIFSKFEEAMSRSRDRRGIDDLVSDFDLGSQKKGGDDTATSGNNAAANKAAAAAADELARLQAELSTAEETINASYIRRVEIIHRNTAAGSAVQEELYSRAKASRAADLADMRKTQESEAAARMAGVESVRASLLSKEEALIAHYERQREIILTNEQLTAEAKASLIAQIDEAELAARKEHAKASSDISVQTATNSVNQLASIAERHAGKQSGIYQAMFAASKAFALADAAVTIQAGIAKAVSGAPWPANLAAMASVAAATASIIPTIAGTNYSGAYDEGGRIPRDTMGLVGERGPELVHGPANVISRRETARLAKEAMSPKRQQQQAAPTVNNNLRVINSIDPSVMSDFLGTDEGEEIVLNVIRSNPEVMRGVSNG